MIDRKKMQYVTSHVSHNIPYVVQLDSASGGFFQVVDWKTHRTANTSSRSKTTDILMLLSQLFTDNS